MATDNDDWMILVVLAFLGLLWGVLQTATGVYIAVKKAEDVADVYLDSLTRPSSMR